MNVLERAIVRSVIDTLRTAATLLGSLFEHHPPHRGRVKVHFVHPTINELLTPLETKPMPLVQKIKITVPGDSKFGYIVSGLAFANAAGGVADPQPSTEQVEASSDRPDVVPSVRYLGDGRAHFTTNDAAAPESIANASFSIDASRSDDDGTLEITLLPDRLMSVNMEGVTIEEATEEVP